MVAEASHAGRTVFMSSHVLGEVQQTAQRVGIVRQGRLVTVERVETLRERAVRKVEIHFATPVPAAEFAALPGVSDLRPNGAVLRDVVTKTLWDARRSVAGWAVAVAATYAAFWPSVNTPQVQQALRRYPEGVLEAFSYDDLTSPAGYLASSAYGLLVPLLVAVLAIAFGTRAVASDEEPPPSSCCSPTR
jgi:hypothetical protein